MSVGTVFTELDLDFSKFERNQQKLLASAQSTSLSVEKNWQALGAKSDVIYQAMANGAINAYNMISNRAQTSAAEQFRAQSAMIAKVNSLNMEAAKSPLYETLGIRSKSAIEAQKTAVITSYEAIKKSGTASSQDLINIEHAKNEKLKSLNKEMVGDHEMSMAAMTRAVLRFYAAYYVISAAGQWIGNLFMGGIKAIDDLKMNTIAVASIITSMQGTTGNIVEYYRKNLVYADALNKKLMEIDANTAANYDQLQLMNRAAISNGVLLDVNNQKQIASFTAISNTVAFLTKGQNQEIQYSQEINALMKGEIGSKNRVAQMIDNIVKQEGKYKGGLEEVVKLGKQHGDTWERLMPYFAGINAASSDISSTWSAVSSSLQTAWGIVQRGLFAGVYETLTTEGTKAVQWMKKNSEDIVKSIRDIASGFKYATEAGLAFLGVLSLIQSYAAATTAWKIMNTAIKTGTVLLTVQCAALTAWNYIVSGPSVWAINSLGAAMKAAFGVFSAFFIGWEIGTLLNKFEIVRQAGVAMVYGIMNAWAGLVEKVRIGAEYFKMAFAIHDDPTNYKATIDATKARVAAIKEGYETEKKIRDQYGREQFEGVTDSGIAYEKARAKALARAGTTVPNVGKGAPDDDKLKKAKSDAEALQKRWADLKLQLESDISTTGLSEFDKKLADIDLKAAKYKEDFKKISGAGSLIDRWADVQGGREFQKNQEEVFKQYLKDQTEGYDALKNLEKGLTDSTATELQKRISAIDEAAEKQQELADKAISTGRYQFEELTGYYQKIEDTRKKLTAEAQADFDRSMRESRINERFGALDLAEATGTMRHADTLSERISGTKDLIADQEKVLDQMDRMKDLSAWNSQLEKVVGHYKTLAALSREMAMQSPFGAAKLALTDYANYAADIGPKIYDSINSAFKGLTDTLVDFCMTGKDSFRDLANSIIKDLLRITIESSITGPMASGLNSLLGLGASLLGGFAGGGGSSYGGGETYMTAMGNAFQNGRVLAFANGGIFDRPTYFPMANGMGLMGEAGPEAVIPLKRTKSGKLGIEGGNSITINIPLTVHGVTKKQAAELRSEIEDVCESWAKRNI
jgi:hypothetical protein